MNCASTEPRAVRLACRITVYVHLASVTRDAARALVDFRLHLAACWADDPDRRPGSRVAVIGEVIGSPLGYLTAAVTATTS
jgi:hypothetical protein